MVIDSQSSEGVFLTIKLYCIAFTFQYYGLDFCCSRSTFFVVVKEAPRGKIKGKGSCGRDLQDKKQQ